MSALRWACWLLAPVLAVLPCSAQTSLVANGTFELAATNEPSRPAGWFPPDGLGVQWADSGDAARGRCIRMDTRVSEREMVAQWERTGLRGFWDIPNAAGNAIAETYGLSYYSDAIPVRSGQAYRVSFLFKGASGGAKVWVRGWGMYRGEKRRRYEIVVNAEKRGTDAWTRFTGVFNPTRARPEVTEMKVMLYAFYPAGVYWFDDVRLEAITDEEYKRER